MLSPQPRPHGESRRGKPGWSRKRSHPAHPRPQERVRNNGNTASLQGAQGQELHFSWLCSRASLQPEDLADALAKLTSLPVSRGLAESQPPRTPPRLQPGPLEPLFPGGCPWAWGPQQVSGALSLLLQTPVSGLAGRVCLLRTAAWGLVGS